MTVRARAHLVDHRRFEIEKDASRHVFPGARFGEEGVERIILNSAIRFRRHLSTAHRHHTDGFRQFPRSIESQSFASNLSRARVHPPSPPRRTIETARARRITRIKKTRTPVESRVRDNTVPNTSSPFGSQPARCARRSLPACRSFSLFVRVFVSRERRSDDRAFGWSDIGERVDVAAANLDARARVTHGARRPFASIRCDSNPSPCLIVHL